jgi:signal recognition particle GTPase
VDHLRRCRQDISRALIESDVNIKLVSTLRKAVKEKVTQSESAAGGPSMRPSTWLCHHSCLLNVGTTGLNRRKMIQKSVMEELVRMIDPGSKPYQLKKGGPSVPPATATHVSHHTWLSAVVRSAARRGSVVASCSPFP